jgi:hypothetical protein
MEIQIFLQLFIAMELDQVFILVLKAIKQGVDLLKFKEHIVLHRTRHQENRLEICNV